jgi:alpha-glucuronidase
MFQRNTIIIYFVLLIFSSSFAQETNGHHLWLHPVTANPVHVSISSESPAMKIAKSELEGGWKGSSNATFSLKIVKDRALKQDGFILKENAVEALSDLGILYGTYELLRRQQTEQDYETLISNPSYQFRVLNHWDNLDGTIERGYSGESIFWRAGDEAFVVTENDRLLWREYARANASIGLNGAVLNNVNTVPEMLSANYLNRVKAIADALRPYGIKTYLSINFATPIKLGSLKTADPLNAEVIKWWTGKVAEIYKLVPDFGGFLVKANSEGQPGPQDYGRTHVDGANMLADILKPHNGIVMWRAFVYHASETDRTKQAYSEFVPLDGKFRDNVIVQVKNGPLDFQPREPFSPLFGAMQKTALMPELQITQEYLGHANQLVFLSVMWEEFLNTHTYYKGAYSPISKCTDGSIFSQKYTAIAGVANIGKDDNWCGHDFAQANWYAFGRMSWNTTLTSAAIANEWLRLTFPAHKENTERWKNGFLAPVKEMMLQSREATVNYSMPLGLHHIFAGDHHYGPGPWYAPNIRKDWTPPYYHQAGPDGIGFNRGYNGSKAVEQYNKALAVQFNDPKLCPDIYLLWFHHLPWDYKLANGRILWDELCYRYQKGLDQVRAFQKTWDETKGYVDEKRFFAVQSKLKRQCRDAQFWKDGCILYFQQFSKLPVPGDIERPVNDLEYYEKTNPLTLKSND